MLNEAYEAARAALIYASHDLGRVTGDLDRRHPARRAYFAVVDFAGATRADAPDLVEQTLMLLQMAERTESTPIFRLVLRVSDAVKELADLAPGKA